MIKTNDLQTIIAHAINMQKKAIAPYSHFNVGATLQTFNGILIGGFNIESASYGLTVCAERVAIINALTAGHRKFTHLILVTNNGSFPCGACRQMIYEFCHEVIIVIATPTAIIKQTTIQTLLPDGFGNNDLEISKKANGETIL